MNGYLKVKEFSLHVQIVSIILKEKKEKSNPDLRKLKSRPDVINIARVNLYVPDKIKEKAEELNINFSKTLKDGLIANIKFLDSNYIMPKNTFIIHAICPGCHTFTQTSSINQIRCKGCGIKFRVYTRTYGIRGKILKGEDEIKKAINRLWGGNVNV